MQQEAPVTTEKSNILLGLGSKPNFALLRAFFFSFYLEIYALEAITLYKEENEYSLWSYSFQIPGGVHFRHLKDEKQCDFQ